MIDLTTHHQEETARLWLLEKYGGRAHKPKKNEPPLLRFGRSLWGPPTKKYRRA